MKIFIDIDNTICTTQGNNYVNSEPDPVRIAKVNSLYLQGHHITMWTARGTMTGIDWTGITTTQLSDWGVMYHELKFGKPAFDLFIDDKVLNSLMHWTDDNIRQIT